MATKASSGASTAGIHLEIANVRVVVGGLAPRLELQVRGEQLVQPPTWWPADPALVPPGDYFKSISDALEKKKMVVAKLAVTSHGELVVSEIAIQHAS